ncbi:MAG: alpha-N-acetylglucosaminidase C-terminal domain-containing protein [Clostridia bacterium]|nr:alpha-N-acetylglucosaminidase C-terminal domain-containing protein [Clostridia bacterium]
MTELIARITPFMADRFVTEPLTKKDGFDRYEIEAVGDNICLRGSSKSAVAAAYYRYLRDYCNMDLSPCGNTEVYAAGEPIELAGKVEQFLTHKLRYAMDYEIYANDAYAWDLRRWEWELDYLAMQGVNLMYMPIGQEAVWYYGALKLGVNREDAMGFLSSPCYFPLQLAGMIDSYLPLTDTNYLKAQIELGKNILTRMREVGIEPILPAFSGHVPQYIKGYFPKSSLYFVTPYSQFPFTYRVNPDDPLFAALSRALREKQTEYFGTAEYYMADPFLGVSPRVRNDRLFAETGKAILAEIKKTNENAVWVQHGCDKTALLVEDVPSDCTLILNADNNPQIASLGRPYISGIAFNTGAHTVLCGDALGVLEKSFSGDAAGLGVFSGCSFANPLFSACAYRRLTEDASADPLSQFVREAVRRWGSDEACLRDAAALLTKSCYAPDSPALPVGSIPATRPSTQIAHTAPGDTLAAYYENSDLCDALEKMLSSEGDYTDGYAFDVCDVARQMLSNYARRLYVAVMDGYQKRDGRLFETATNAFLRVMSDMDMLLATRLEFNLQHRLTAAGARAEGKTDRQNFEVGFLVSVTIFGPPKAPELYDLRWKEWSDLVGDYYAKRWHKLFTLLAESFKKHKDVSTVCREQIDGRNLSNGNKFCKQLDKAERSWISTFSPKAVSEEDTLSVAGKLLEKYKPLILQDTI